jgi:transcription antitermination factor NusG
VEKASPSEEGEAMDKSTANSASSKKNWFAVYTTCRHEKRVARHLENRHIEHFLPLYRTQHNWKDGTRAVVDLPLFPGYLFVQIALADRLNVLAVPGVVSIVGPPSHPAGLPDFEVATLRAGLDPMRVQPHPLLTVGQRVKIKTGALAGLEGVVLREKSGFRVVLTLDLLMQSIAIEVDGDDVEVVNESSPLTLEHTDKKIKQPQQLPLYQFKRLDSYPEISQVALAAAHVARR